MRTSVNEAGKGREQLGDTRQNTSRLDYVNTRLLGRPKAMNCQVQSEGFQEHVGGKICSGNSKAEMLLDGRDRGLGFVI